ncbi:hypothetical protein CERZMDRAFT_96075 [Cercospora zeae-maydis SCOH1-5]|uniref:Peptidase S33 tripeptidyl aminopeptidase-like C-terminal domain-containing protein n=1 Tax=Cercospora zeae-maydis SCOH1-5 TaxID=717836 RepID=A0A6A6FKP6_9PEZI|nr:hypothetical protein CERZMDRAFT_96075 [Cercospora zeae-maydis SCOH1-5]
MFRTSRVLALIGSLATLASASPLPRPDELPSYGRINFTSLAEDFRWKQIKPSPELEYHDCGGNFKCARLELPLNWNATGPEDLTYGMKYNMAIVKLPAQVPVTDPRYGGPVLFNPGGPGGSGTDSVIEMGQFFQMQIDAAYSYSSAEYVSPNKSARYFDIIGFDPRGVGHSTPYHTCFKSTREASTFHQLHVIQWNETGLAELWEETAALGRKCVWDPATNPSGSLIANFSSSAMVARDLVEFAERHGEWRDKQGTAPPASPSNTWIKGEEPILMYGASYGTLLGATLAAMQPHRVQRFYLDAVIGNWTTDILDHNKIVQKFFEYCAQSGQEQCAMWAGNTFRDTEKRFNELVRRYERFSNHTIEDARLTESPRLTILKIMNELAYSPLDSWYRLARQLANLEDGMFPRQAQLPRETNRDAEALIDANDPDVDPLIVELISPSWLEMIVASDQTFRSSYQQFAAVQWKEMHEVAPWRADLEASSHGGSFNWPIVSGWAFGDKHKVASNVTASPILFASNLIDGVTSVEGARRMNKAFKGSGLLIVDAEGHGTWSSPSLCAAKAVRHYFQTGELPETSKHCLPAERPFIGAHGPDTEKIEWHNLTREDHTLLARWKSHARSESTALWFEYSDS